jgi:hypothetical protein
VQIVIPVTANPKNSGDRKPNKKLNNNARISIATTGVEIVPHTPNASKKEKDDFMSLPLTKIIPPTNRNKINKNKKTLADSPKKEGCSSGTNPALLIIPVAIDAVALISR